MNVESKFIELERETFDWNEKEKSKTKYQNQRPKPKFMKDPIVIYEKPT
jgi:hypothetical protein